MTAPAGWISDQIGWLLRRRLQRSRCGQGSVMQLQCSEALEAFLPLMASEFTAPGLRSAVAERGSQSPARDPGGDPSRGELRFRSRGPNAELTELFAAEVLPIEGQETEVASNVIELVSYARAAEAVYGWIEERTITLWMLASLQAELVRGTESDGPEAGSIRTSRVLIGPGTAGAC